MPAPERRPLVLRFLDRVEWLGNKLPEPAVLFVILSALVVGAAALGDALDWTVRPVRPKVELVQGRDASGAAAVNADGSPHLVTKLDARGRPAITLVEATKPDGSPEELRPRTLLTREGVYWIFSSAVRNFVALPALGLVFVAMLGVGVAERVGLFAAIMRLVASGTPRALLTPAVVFIGANASVASDAGIVILPPLAAALYFAVGRSPVAGLAAAFAGVSGGFGAGFFPTASDAYLAGVATQAARILDPAHGDVTVLHNWYFKSASAIVIMFAGWFVTDRLIEPRFPFRPDLASADLPTAADASVALAAAERRGLLAAAPVALLVLAAFAAMILVPGWPLHGQGQPLLADGAPAFRERAGDRWSQAIVPMIFLAFLLPAIAYGIGARTVRSQKDVCEALYHAVRCIAPVLATTFFLAQFVAWFGYTGLDRMLAFEGGVLLVRADLPAPLLLVLFVALVIAADFCITGMLAKFAALAPIFIPMFMMAGVSPELTTAAYRIGDSVVNVITPMSAYLLMILGVLQKYRRDAGLGTLISLMLPYSAAFFVAWTAFLVCWYFTGLPVGPDAPLHYVPPH